MIGPSFALTLSRSIEANPVSSGVIPGVIASSYIFSMDAVFVSMLDTAPPNTESVPRDVALRRVIRRSVAASR